MPVAKAPLETMATLGLTNIKRFKEVCKREYFLAYKQNKSDKSCLDSLMSVLFVVARGTDEICYLLHVAEILSNEAQKAWAKKSEIT